MAHLAKHYLSPIIKSNGCLSASVYVTQSNFTGLLWEVNLSQRLTEVSACCHSHRKVYAISGSPVSLVSHKVCT